MVRDHFPYLFVLREIVILISVVQTAVEDRGIRATLHVELRSVNMLAVTVILDQFKIEIRSEPFSCLSLKPLVGWPFRRDKAAVVI